MTCSFIGIRTRNSKCKQKHITVFNIQGDMSVLLDSDSTNTGLMYKCKDLFYLYAYNFVTFQ